MQYYVTQISAATMAQLRGSDAAAAIAAEAHGHPWNFHGRLIPPSYFGAPSVYSSICRRWFK
jgi:hypothetical protein